jgi:hypothetical protein
MPQHNLHRRTEAARYTCRMPRILRATMAVALLSCGALLVACSAAPPRVADHATRGSAVSEASPDPAAVIYLVRRHWHVDIGFAANDLQPPLAALLAQFPDARYLLFGFGDRHYLVDQDRGMGGMLAALWPGAGVMLVTGLRASAQDAFGEQHVSEIRVSASQAQAAQRFVWQSLAAQRGAITPLRAGPYEGSLYYATPQRYSALHTCNTWAAQALRAAQLPVHSAGVVFAGQLWNQARRL